MTLLLKSASNVQNPASVDGDSVYAKDIDLDRSDITGWTGTPIDPFNDLYTVNANNSSDNPKIFLIHFKRTIISPLVGVGSSEGGNFSNVKLIGILSGGVETVLQDYSSDNTKRTTQFFSFPNTGLNAFRLEFHTADPVEITNIFMTKLVVVASIPETPVTYGDSYFSPYLENASSQVMNVDGSVTPVDFSYTFSGIGSARWFRSFIDLQDGNQDFLPENFGAIVGGLTNGVEIISVRDGVEKVLETWKTNMDISMTMYDFYSPYRTGSYIGRWTMPRDVGNPITFFPDDSIIARINDNLTPLDAFRFRIKYRQ